MGRVRALLGISLMALASPAAADPAVLIGPFPVFLPSAGLSGDGAFVVGHEAIPAPHPYRWSPGSATPELLSLQDSALSLDASADGAVVVGYRSLPLGAREAFRWTAAGGLVPLPTTPVPGPLSTAYAVSGDGSIAAGEAKLPGNLYHAVTWTGSNPPTDLGVLPADALAPTSSSRAHGISADGGTVVGESEGNFGTYPTSVHAVQWTQAGATQLPDLPGGEDYARAYAASADGNIVVGLGTEVDSNHQHAVRWVGGIPEDLGDLPGNSSRSEARAVSADGEVVVGESSSSVGTGAYQFEAFLWTPRMGMRSLKQILTQDFGLALGDLYLEEAVAVSDDGLQILALGAAGFYLARLPYLPGHPACDDHADDDGDGLVDQPDDPGCQTASSTLENPKCDDDLDNDGDGKVDWDGGSAATAPDPQCAGAAWKNAEAPSGCGMGAELVLALPLLSVFARRRNG